MYDLRQIVEIMETLGLGVAGENIFTGRFDTKDPNKFMLTQDVSVAAMPLTYGQVSKYERGTVKVVFNGTKSYTESASKLTTLYNYFRENPNIKTHGLIQVQPEQPVLLDKEKDIYKYVLLINIIYDKEYEYK